MKIIILIVINILYSCPNVLNQGIKCPKMIAPPYGSLLKCDNNTVGDTCYIRCPQGWDVIGDCFKVCKSDGTWSGVEVMCLNRAKQCPPLESPTNGQISLPCLTVAGGYCGYTCNGQNGQPILDEKGKALVTRVFCTELGTWNTTANCNIVSGPCGAMIPPVSSYFLSTCTGNYNEVCAIQCSLGFYLIGDPTLTCLPTGKWSKYKGDPTFPRCLPLRPGQKPPPNTGLPIVDSCPAVNPPFNGYAEGSCSTAKVGDTCKFGCNPGFVISGIGAFKCGTDLKWDRPPAATCIVQRSLCFNITAVPEARKSPDCKALTVGSTCTINCAPNETPKTPIVLKCLQSGWDNPYPKCTPNRCPKVNPLSVPNSVMKGIGCSDGYLDDVCFFTCNPGYAMVGSGTLVCTESGSWLPATFPQCIQISCVPQLLPPNVVVSPLTCNSRIGVGSTCTYSCGPCSIVETFANTPPGSFPGSFPVSPGRFPTPGSIPGNIPPAPAPVTPNNPPAVPGNPGNAPGSPGSAPRNPESAPRNPENAPRNPENAPRNPENAPKNPGNAPKAPQVSSNTPVTATCLPNGLFDKQPPICRSIFCPRPTIPLALFSANCGTCGLECIMSCEAGYRLSSNVFPRCTATGQWSGQFPTCIAGPTRPPSPPAPLQCPVIQPPLNGYWIEGSCGGRVTNCNAACYDCFDLEDYQTSRYTCANGVWTPNIVIARCSLSLATCPDLRLLLAASGGQVLNQCTNRCGTTCQYQCNNGQNIQTTKCTRQRFRETQGQTPFGQVNWNPTPFCQYSPPQPPPPTQPPAPQPVRQCIGEAPAKGFWLGCSGGDDCNRCVRQIGQSCSLRCYDGYDLVNNGFQIPTILFTCTTSGQWNTNPFNARCEPRVATVPGRPR